MKKALSIFLAMLMIGIGFRLEADRVQIGRIVKHLITRYAVAAALALMFWFALPFDEFVRRVLVLLVFGVGLIGEGLQQGGREVA